MKFEITLTDKKERIDALLADRFAADPKLRGFSRSTIAKLLKEGRLRVNGKTVSKSSFRPNTGDSIELDVPDSPLASELAAEHIPLDIIHEDASVLVLNKPPELVVHPGAGQVEHTLVNGLIHYLGPAFSGVGAPQRPGIVHRLDKGTSGVMVVAKTDQAYQHLVRQFTPPRTIHRRYLAVTARLPKQSSVTAGPVGVIALPIKRHAQHRVRMTVGKDGRAAETNWWLVEELKHGYVLELSLTTGRTHQIRVHLQACGAALLGDPVYGSLGQLSARQRVAAKQLGRQALHALRLRFVHPLSDRPVTYEAPVPEDLLMTMEMLRRA